MSYNKVVLVGNCTKDGELRYSQNGSEIYKNSIATSHKFTVNGEKREETMFIDFTAFSKLGLICNQYLRKGSKILVEGRLNFEQWTDKDGQKRSKHSVIVETMQMLGSRGGGDTSDPQNTGANAPVSYEKKNMQEPPVGGGEYIDGNGFRQNNLQDIDVSDMEIPF